MTRSCSRGGTARGAARVVALAVVLAACGQGVSTVDPGPGDTDGSSTTTSTTSTSTPEEQDGDDDGGDELVTDGNPDSVTTTTNVALPIGPGDGVGDGGADGIVDGDATSENFVLADDTENGAVYVELAESGLVLTVEEQECADTSATSAVDAGSDPLDGVIGAVQECATPRALDDFASTLIIAGGQPLPPTEAACVGSKLRDGETYRPFWASLLEQEPFDFLLADTDVQNRYLDLFADCVSVGRAVSEQTNAPLSIATMGCIDALYADREFVRITIEADLSGNVEDLARIDSQLSGCLTPDEQALLTGN